MSLIGTLGLRGMRVPSIGEFAQLTRTLVLRIGKYLERQGLLKPSWVRMANYDTLPHGKGAVRWPDG